MFTEHQHLLVAALSALKACKGVLNSMQDDQLLGQMRTKQTTFNYEPNDTTSAASQDQVLSPVPRHLMVKTNSTNGFSGQKI